MAWFPNGEGSGQHYIQLWDFDNAQIYNAGSVQVLFQTHWYDMCRVTSHYYNGSSWIPSSPEPGGEWNNFGIMATAWTRCTLRICQQTKSGTYQLAEHTYGP